MSKYANRQIDPGSDHAPPGRYDGEKLRHIGQGCVYFYSGDSMEHLTDYVQREAVFGQRVLPILVVDRDCRMHADCPRYSPWEWIPKMISVSPPAHFGFSHQEALEALNEIAAENDRIKEWIQCDLVTITRISGDKRIPSSNAVTSVLNRLINRATRLVRDRDARSPYRLQNGCPAPCRYFDEPVVIVPYRSDVEFISFETYKSWEAEESKKRLPDQERLPLEFHAPLRAVESFLAGRGVDRFDIINIEKLRQK